MKKSLQQTTLSISCVLHFTAIKDLSRCLESVAVAAACFERDVVFYVVDNSESEDYQSQVELLLAGLITPGVRVVFLCSEKNQGYGAANNSVLNRLESDFHLVINPDVTVEPDAFSVASSFLMNNPKVGMVTPAVADEEGVFSHVVKRYPDCLTLLLRFFGASGQGGVFSQRIKRYTCEMFGNRPVNLDLELAGGCFFFLRTDVFQEIGGFDPRYFLYFEDFDLCMRLRRHKSISYVPEVRIMHGGGDVGRKSRRHHWYFSASAVRFFSAYGWKLL